MASRSRLARAGTEHLGHLVPVGDGVPHAGLPLEAAGEAPEGCFPALQRLRELLAAIGEVVLRDENARNPKLVTGDVEVQATEIIILNDARTLPFQLDVSDESLAAEDLRLKYRYLDLRRPQLQANLRLRHRLILEINRYMDEQGFTQIETPNLIKSTPEGARDYIGNPA